MKKELELYIHIPFCVKKCAYCDFLSAPSTEEGRESYIGALRKEIAAHRKAAEAYEVTTIFFGGGTPSILSGDQMARILETIRKSFVVREDAEITMEANPGTVAPENLRKYRQAGINRISFGLQSVNNEELRMLGRVHTYETFLESYAFARDAGFTNINIDLISAIPGQTLESWERTLRTVIELEPEHISAYSLIIEDGTPFAKMYGEGGEKAGELPDEDTERRIYKRTEELLRTAGYFRYEISNYGKQGYACRHNLGYWERKEYLGLGLGASSLIGNVRYCNTDDMREYLEQAENPERIRRNPERLTEEEQMEEFVFLGLRKTEGISTAVFERTFGRSIWECYGENIRTVIEKGLLETNGAYLRLTENGIDVSNYVFAEILYERNAI